MIDIALEPLTMALRESEFLATLRGLRHDGGTGLALGGEPTRLLRDAEIRQLVANGNSADDWQSVRVVEGFRPGRVRHSEFSGTVILGRFEESLRGPGDLEFPSGVYRSTLANCVIGHDALVRNVGLLSGYAVGKKARVADCGRVFCKGTTAFGNGLAIPIGPQCGGRWLRPFAEITLDLCTRLTMPPAAGGMAERYAGLLEEYVEQVRCSRGVIGAGASVTHVAVVRNVHVGPAAEIDAATRVEESTLLSSPDEPVRVRDGACISNSLLQWAVEVRGPAVVERSVLLEHSAVDPLGKVASSVIGPNSGVGGSEVASSLVGPFVGCHHQGLLIAARWPAGRGNLGYGAAVGCNHTSRAPDQEAVLGEGLFIGLGANLQYPIDLANAPYTVLASGLNFPSQKLAFPFSLVRAAPEPILGAPAGANVLIPAWVLSDNLYSVQRAAFKYRTRDRSTRHRLEHDVFRPEVMALVANALHRLEHPARMREVYTEKEIPGLGRNLLTERHRLAAITCYGDHLERYRLQRLLEAAKRAIDADCESTVASHPVWKELSRLIELSEAYGVAVERSKSRDEQRGPLVIDDYADAHRPTREDPVVLQTWSEVRRIQKDVARVLAATGQHPDGSELVLAGEV